MKRRQILLGIGVGPLLMACGPKVADYDLNNGTLPRPLPEDPVVEEAPPECNNIVRPPPPYAPAWDLVEERRFDTKSRCRSFRYSAHNRETGVKVDLTPFGNSIHAAWKAGALG